MKTVITDDLMFSPEHPHTATVVGPGLWEVSWIPARTFTWGQAVTAMQSADYLTAMGTTDPARLSRADLGFLGHWADELGLLTSELLTLFESATRS